EPHNGLGARPIRRSRPMRPATVALVTAATLPALALLLIPAPPAPAGGDPKGEPLVKQVDTAIKKGQDYPPPLQCSNGDWEQYGVSGRKGGATALALLALLNAGVPPNDAVIKNGLGYLRGVKPRDTYVVALQTMVYCLAGEDKQRIQENVA